MSIESFFVTLKIEGCSSALSSLHAAESSHLHLKVLVLLVSSCDSLEDSSYADTCLLDILCVCSPHTLSWSLGMEACPGDAAPAQRGSCSSEGGGASALTGKVLGVFGALVQIGWKPGGRASRREGQPVWDIGGERSGQGRERVGVLHVGLTIKYSIQMLMRGTQWGSRLGPAPKQL